jgi:hypothetical protein
MTVNRETFANDAESTLNGAIDSNQTAILVDDGSVFPSTGNFRVLCGTEIMHCTARSGNTLTVNRAIEGTTGVAHSSGATIIQSLTVDALLRAGQDNVPLYGCTSRPPFGLYDASGGIINSSHFTVVNQNATVITDLFGTMGIVKPAYSGASQNCTFLVESVVAPFTRILAFQFRGGRSQTLEHLEVGLVIRESATGKAILFNKDYNQGTKLGAYRFTDAITHSGANSIAAANFDFSEVVWLKIEVSTSTVKYHYSADGIEWMQMASELDTAFITGDIDQVGIGLNCLQTNFPLHARVLHYSAE